MMNAGEKRSQQGHPHTRQGIRKQVIAKVLAKDSEKVRIKRMLAQKNRKIGKKSKSIKIQHHKSQSQIQSNWKYFQRTK
jgi:hypothetical protein